MSGSTGYHPAGVLMYCNATAYNGMDNVTVQVNERVNVSWPDGNAPFEIRRLNGNTEEDVDCPARSFNGGYLSFDIDWSANNRSFIWNVDEQYNFSVWANGTANSTKNATFQAPGDWTVFIAVQKEDMDSHYWGNHEYQYWTSPRYVVGNNPLPSNAADRSLSIKAGLMLGMLAMTCLTSLL